VDVLKNLTGQEYFRVVDEVRDFGPALQDWYSNNVNPFRLSAQAPCILIGGLTIGLIIIVALECVDVLLCPSDCCLYSGVSLLVFFVVACGFLFVCCFFL
jgi:hypothetical protein